MAWSVLATTRRSDKLLRMLLLTPTSSAMTVTNALLPPNRHLPMRSAAPMLSANVCANWRKRSNLCPGISKPPALRRLGYKL